MGLTEDLENAVEWYFKAAEQGHGHAEFTLGYCYMNGHGLAENPEREVCQVGWYTKAAEQGHVSAAFHLGCCYEDGEGVVRENKRQWCGIQKQQSVVMLRHNSG